MPFFSPSRWARSLKTKAASPATRSVINVTTLEDRLTPAIGTIADQSPNTSIADGASRIIDTSADGNYILFSSTSTNLIPGQQDTAGTTDLFWADVSGAKPVIKMVTALPRTVTNQAGQPIYDYSTSTIGGASYVRELGFGDFNAFGDAVLSDDGQFVAFSSKVPVYFVDRNFAYFQNNPSSGTPIFDTKTDPSNSTFDVFRWESGDGNTKLVSFTVAQPSSNDPDFKVPLAFGRFGAATEPAISADGSVVTFLSAVDGGVTSPEGVQPPYIPIIGGGLNEIFDDNTSVDIFLTSFRNKIQTTVQPLTSINAAGVLDDTAFYFMLGSLGGSVSVDDRGRYLNVSNGGIASVAYTAPFQADNSLSFGGFFGFPGYNAFKGVVNKTDVVLPPNITTLQDTNAVSTSANIINRLLGTPNIEVNPTTFSVTDDIDPATGNTVGIQDVVANVVIASQDALDIFYTQTTAGSTSTLNQFFYHGGVRVQTNTNPLGQNLGSFRTDSFDLSPNGDYLAFEQRGTGAVNAPTQVYFYINSDFNNNTFTSATTSTVRKAILVSGTIVNDAKATGNASEVTVLANTTGASLPHVSQDGHYVSFTSADNAQSLTGNINVLDTNNVNDVFVHDFFSGTDLTIARKNYVVSGDRDSRVTNITPVNIVKITTGNRASNSGFLGSSPTVIPTSTKQDFDFTARVLFNSVATNIDLGTTPANAGQTEIYHSIYETELPLGKHQPIALRTTAKPYSLISGGLLSSDASVQVATYTGNDAGNDTTVTLSDKITPFVGFRGEIRTAMADIDGDTIPDLIVAAGPGAGPRVVAYSGATQTKLLDFFVFDKSFRGGVNLAVDFIASDPAQGTKDATIPKLVVGADRGGGPRVRVFDISDLSKFAVPDDATNYASSVVSDFFAFDNTTFRGGVRVAIGDVNFDGVKDLAVGAGTGGGPRVKVINGLEVKRGIVSPRLLGAIDFFAMESSLRNGVNLAVEDINRDGFAEVIVGAGTGGSPRVRVFEGQSLLANPRTATVLYDFFAGDPNSRSGVRVAAKDVDGDYFTDVVTGEGFGQQPRVRAYSGGHFASINALKEIPSANFVHLNDLNSFNGAWVG